jgi:hypothetical protein
MVRHCARVVNRQPDSGDPRPWVGVYARTMHDSILVQGGLVGFQREDLNNHSHDHSHDYLSARIANDSSSDQLRENNRDYQVVKSIDVENAKKIQTLNTCL